MSEEGQQQARRNQENARHKTYPHTMGLGGYPTAIPKWKKAKQELIDRGLMPESLDWPERAKHWFFAHGGRLDLETGKVMYGGTHPSCSRKISSSLLHRSKWRVADEQR
jgi:hypothetical protein